jgi:hypothetical protein
MWMTGLTDLTPLVPNGLEFGTLSVPLDVALEDACVNPSFAETSIEQVHADVLFVGAQEIANPMYPWDLTCIAQLPNLRLVDSVPWHGTEAAVFAVTR